MPTYTFIDTKTGESTTTLMSIAEMEAHLRDHSRLSLAPAAPLIVTGVASKRNKPDDSFRDILRNIKRRHRGSTINTF
jgi:hypothetical protein